MAGIFQKAAERTDRARNFLRHGPLSLSRRRILPVEDHPPRQGNTSGQKRPAPGRFRKSKTQAPSRRIKGREFNPVRTGKTQSQGHRRSNQPAARAATGAPGEARELNLKYDPPNCQNQTAGRRGSQIRNNPGNHPWNFKWNPAPSFERRDWRFAHLQTKRRIAKVAMNPNPSTNNLPISGRSVFFDMATVRASMGVTADKVRALVESGGLLWTSTSAEMAINGRLKTCASGPGAAQSIGRSRIEARRSHLSNPAVESENIQRRGDRPLVFGQSADRQADRRGMRSHRPAQTILFFPRANVVAFLKRRWCGAQPATGARTGDLKATPRFGQLA